MANETAFRNFGSYDFAENLDAKFNGLIRWLDFWLEKRNENQFLLNDLSKLHILLILFFFVLGIAS